jgi:hypothetical protein
VLAGGCPERTQTEDIPEAPNGHTAMQADIATETGPPPRAATIACIGNFRGFQKPCGCAIQQSGGLLRLGTVVQHLHAVLEGSADADEATGQAATRYKLPASLALPQPLWLIECGNFADPRNRYPAPRARTHLETLAYLKPYGAVAAVPGSAELQLPSELAVEALAGSPIPLVSCNLRTELAGVKVEPHIKLAQEWYLIGITSWSPASEEPPEQRWWELDDPVASAGGVIAGLPKGSQVILVAPYQSGEVTRALAALPVTLLIGHGSTSDKQWQAGWAPGYPIPPGKATALKLLSISTEAESARAAIRPWTVELTEVWADDEHVVEMVKAEGTLVREMVRQQPPADLEGWRSVDWGSAEQYLPDEQARYKRYTKSPPIYVGPRVCRDCHAAACDIWEQSRHARALISLMQKAEHETLDCLECHVAGLLTASGYLPDDPRDEVTAVTCESCHGPASVHVGLMQLGRDSTDPGVLRGTTADCLSCHDSYNSPEFEQRAYWDRIKH